MNSLINLKYQTEPNWNVFYCTLIRLGPWTLRNIPHGWIRWFQLDGAATDCFWSEDIEERLFSLWSESPERAVGEALAQYVASVQSMLTEFPYGTEGPGWRTDPSSGDVMPWPECVASITCEPIHPRVFQALLAAAKQPCEDDATPATCGAIVLKANSLRGDFHDNCR